MPLHLPPLTSLRTFEAAARHGSFRKAADELNLTRSAVSHSIDTLERWMGVALFLRQGSSVRVTEAGATLLPYVSEGLSTIALGVRRVARGQAGGSVSVSTAPTFASHWLVPRLPRFRARHPEITLSIDTNHRRVAFPHDDIDVAIRMGKVPWPGLSSTLLFRERLVPVATDHYWAEVRRPDGGIAWDRAVLLHVRNIEHDWPTWFERRGIGPMPPDGIHFDTARLALDAAAAGLGVALGREPLCAMETASGRVTPLAGEAVPVETGYWLTVPDGTEPRRDVRAFMRWVLAENGTEEMSPGDEP